MKKNKITKGIQDKKNPTIFLKSVYFNRKEGVEGRVNQKIGTLNHKLPSVSDLTGGDSEQRKCQWN